LQSHIEDPTEHISGYVEMLSTTVLGVAICSRDFAVTVRDTGWVPAVTIAAIATRRERPSIQRPPQPPGDVSHNGGVVGNPSRNCDCIRCWAHAVGGTFMSAEYLFVFLFLFGIVLALAARTGFIFGARRASGRLDAEATTDGLG
jgi:hypothetical protein